jgi:hypothetical protein
MKHIECAVTLLVAVTLAGCSPKNATDLAACQNEADRFYQGRKEIDMDDPRSRYIIECMTTKGYDFDVYPTACSDRHPFPTQPACFVRSNWLARTLDHFVGR